MKAGSPEYCRHVAHQIGVVCREEGNLAQLMAHPLAVFPTPLPPLCLQVLHQQHGYTGNIAIFPGRTVITRADHALVRTLVYPTTIGGLS